MTIRARLRTWAFRGARRAATVLRLAPRRLPEAPALEPLVPERAIRLLIAPANSSGQAALWAAAVQRARPDVGAVSMAVVPAADRFRFPVDQAVPLATYRWSRDWSRRQRETVTTRFTHVLVESGRRLYTDAGPAGEALREFRALQDAGVRVGLVFHGTDIRDGRAHARHEWSPFRDAAATAGPVAHRARENARLAAELGAPTFVTTPDLLDELPDARWLPIVVDPARWRTGAPALERDRLVVVHAPSNAAVKGTHLIEPVLRALDAEGVIEYRRLEHVASAEMPARYAEADIVLDQFRLGAYGATAIEALAAGRLVIAHVRHEVRERIRAATGRGVPILEATPDTLGAVLRGVVADRRPARELVEDGVAYVSSVHDGARSAAVLDGFLR